MKAEEKLVIPGRKDNRHIGPETGKSLACSGNREIPLVEMY